MSAPGYQRSGGGAGLSKADADATYGSLTGDNEWTGTQTFDNTPNVGGTNVATAGDIAQTLGVVVQNTDGSWPVTSRPTGFAQIRWIATVAGGDPGSLAADLDELIQSAG